MGVPEWIVVVSWGGRGGNLVRGTPLLGRVWGDAAPYLAVDNPLLGGWVGGGVGTFL